MRRSEAAPFSRDAGDRTSVLSSARVPSLRAGGDVLCWNRRGTPCGELLRVDPQGPGAAFFNLSRAVKKRAARAGESALTLFVAQVLADHHDPPMTADHFALVADLLDARMNLHLPAVFIGLFVTDPHVRADRVEPVGSGVVMPVEPVERSAVTEDNATAGQVIRAELHPRGPLGGSGCSAVASCPRCERGPCGRW